MKKNGFFRDCYGDVKIGWEVAGFMGVAIGGVAIFVAGVMAIVTPIALHQTAISCHNYQVNTGIQTKFVEYNSFWDYGCLGMVDGRWVPTQNIQGVNGLNK